MNATFKDTKPVIDSVVHTLHPLSVILFGSVAKQGVGRDMDLLIVTADKQKDPLKLNLLLRKPLEKFYNKFAIDPFIISHSLLNEYYKKGSPFVRLICREGRLLYMKNAVKEWLKQAEDEVNMADYLFGGGFLKGACYHAQQSIEKTIKAMLLAKGWELEKVHSLERLSAITKDYKIRLTFSDEEVVFIDSIYRGRYPAEAGLLPYGEPSRTDAQKAIKIAKRIYKEMNDV